MALVCEKRVLGGFGVVFGGMDSQKSWTEIDGIDVFLKLGKIGVRSVRKLLVSVKIVYFPINTGVLSLL